MQLLEYMLDSFLEYYYDKNRVNNNKLSLSSPIQKNERNEYFTTSFE